MNDTVSVGLAVGLLVVFGGLLVFNCLCVYVLVRELFTGDT